MGYDLSDYIDVQTRIKMFYEIYPQGSIQFEFKGIMPGNPDFIWGIAYAYRTPDDQRPGIGTASEAAQGKTAFTRGSELANLETSCWGRALGSLNIGINKSIASKQEVESAKQRESERNIPQVNLDPWGEETSQTIKTLTEMGMIPDCAHGPMKRIEGENKQTGRPYAGWVCQKSVKECAIWDR